MKANMFFRIESLLSSSITRLSFAMDHVAPNLNFKVKDDWIEPGLCRQTERCNKTNDLQTRNIARNNPLPYNRPRLGTLISSPPSAMFEEARVEAGGAKQARNSRWHKEFPSNLATRAL
jgi:hypothetical protein